MDQFDRLGDQLNDIIGDHKNNNVKYMAEQVFGFASGGAVLEPSDDSAAASDTDLSNPLNLARAVAKAGKTVYGGGDNADSALGKLSSYNSPLFLTGHIQAAGKFFNGAEPGNLYTNRYKQPEPNKPTASENPTDFYARWYNRMREFAQASEVADRGQSQVRGT